MKAIFMLILQPLLFQLGFSHEIKNGLAIVNNCSAGLVKLNAMPNTSKALVVSNGHCLQLKSNYGYHSEYLNPNEHLLNVQDVNFLNKTIIRLHAPKATIDLKAKKLLFATMTGTDIAIFELDESYDDLKDKYQMEPLIISSTPLIKNKPVQIQSGFYNRKFDCYLESYVDLKEGPFQTDHAIQLSKECDIYPGVSGSPIVTTDSNSVVGLANTHASGEGILCGFNNPCIVENKNKSIFIQPKIGTSFGISLIELNKCYNFKSHSFDLKEPACKLLLF